MPRKAGVWFRTGRNMFFSTLDGKKTPLHVPGPDTPERRALAEEALSRLLAGLAAPKPEQVPVLTVSAAVASFLAACEGRLAPKTVRDYRRVLTLFESEFGPESLDALKARPVERWAERPTWSSSTRHGAVGTVLTMLRYHEVPLRLRRPAAESRGGSCVLSGDDFRRLLAWLSARRNGELPDYLRVLWHTGARPSEAIGLSADAVDWDHTCVRLRKHKTAGKTGRDRVIRLNADAVAVLRTLRARHPEGPLFVNSYGRPLTVHTVGCRLREASAALGLHAIAYGFRHGFATRALAAGIPDAVVAELLGHKGTGMVHRHYSHLTEHARVLQEAAEKVGRAAG